MQVIKWYTVAANIKRQCRTNTAGHQYKSGVELLWKAGCQSRVGCFFVVFSLSPVSCVKTRSDNKSRSKILTCCSVYYLKRMQCLQWPRNLSPLASIFCRAFVAIPLSGFNSISGRRLENFPLKFSIWIKSVSFTICLCRQWNPMRNTIHCCWDWGSEHLVDHRN